MGNRNSRSPTSAEHRPAACSSSGLAQAPAAAPKSTPVTHSHAPVPPPHPLDVYCQPTALYAGHTRRSVAGSVGPPPACGLRLSEIRALIIARKLAPRVCGCEDEDAVVDTTHECPVCMLYYCPYAINVTTCCHGEICSECYLHVLDANPAHECPFCKHESFSVAYTGDPSPLLGVASAKPDGGGLPPPAGSPPSDADSNTASPTKTPAVVRPSPHLRSAATERISARRERASTAEVDKALLASHGVVFASVEDREAIKREVAAQEVDARRSMAFDAAVRRPPPNPRGSARAASASLGSPGAARSPGLPSPPLSALTPSALPRTPLSLPHTRSSSISRANTAASSVGGPVSGASFDMFDDDDDAGLATMMATLRTAAARLSEGAPGRHTPPIERAGPSGFFGSALRAVSESFRAAAATLSEADAAPSAGTRRPTPRNSDAPRAAAAAVPSQADARTHGGGPSGDDAEASADPASRRARSSSHDSMGAPGTLEGAEALDEQALEDMLIAQAILLSLQEAGGAPGGAARAPDSTAGGASVPGGSAHPSFRARPAVAGAPAAAAAHAHCSNALAVDSSSDTSDEDDDDDDESAGLPRGDPARSRRASTRSAPEDDDEEMLRLALQLSMADDA